MKRKHIIIHIVSLLCIITLIAVCYFMPRVEKASVTGNMRSESYVGGVIYQQSAEVAALYKQTFQLAKNQLDKKIAENVGTGKSLAIVTDIDATLIDDSGYFSGVLTDAEGRKKSGKDPWNNKDWCGYYTSEASDVSKAVPGAVDFVKYAREQGVKIYFITNRPYYELDLTVKQLYHEGLLDEETLKAYSGLEADNGSLQKIYADDELEAFAKMVNDETDFTMGEGYFTLKNDYTIQVQGTAYSSDKAERRSNVAKAMGDNGAIVLYMGDSINDMISYDEYKYTDYSEDESSQFDRTKGNSSRSEAVMNDLWKDKWGTEFIIMPNSAYGDWQKATWYKQSVDENGEADAIRNQLSEHSYLNSGTWYDGVSPVDNSVE
ncbi:MAG: hypothetical protein MJ173_03595 [Clostridia bacterium]|nr:hypothetical protein [Clostridia bacterium]